MSTSCFPLLDLLSTARSAALFCLFKVARRLCSVLCKCVPRRDSAFTPQSWLFPGTSTLLVSRPQKHLLCVRARQQRFEWISGSLATRQPYVLPALATRYQLLKKLHFILESVSLGDPLSITGKMPSQRWPKPGCYKSRSNWISHTLKTSLDLISNHYNKWKHTWRWQNPLEPIATPIGPTRAYQTFSVTNQDPLARCEITPATLVLNSSKPH